MFIPHGLFCLVLRFKPDHKNPGEPIDIAQAILAAALPPASLKLRLSQSIRSSDGTTYQEAELPKAASLVFPDPDELLGARRRNTFKRTKLFVDDYYDRRGKARFVSYDSSIMIISALEIKYRTAR